MFSKYEKGVLFVYVIGVILVLGFWGAVIWVAWHFISKYW